MTDKTADPQIREFIKRIDQLHRVHREAVVFIAAKSIIRKQDEQDPLLVTFTRPKLRTRYWLGNLFRKLIHRFGIPYPGEREGEESVEINYSETQGHILLDITPLPWPLDQPPWIKDNFEFPLQISHPNDEEKGIQSHE